LTASMTAVLVASLGSLRKERGTEQGGLLGRLGREKVKRSG